MESSGQESIQDLNPGFDNTSSQPTTQGIGNFGFQDLYAETLGQGTGGTYPQENGPGNQNCIDSNQDGR